MTTSARTAVWIVSPRVDLFFICGGAMLLLSALHCFARLTSSAHQLQYFGDLAVLLALLLSETHTVSTIFAVDGREAGDSQFQSNQLSRIRFNHLQFRHYQFKHYQRAAGVASLALIFLVCAFGWLAPYVVRLYLLAVSWHFISQARGIIFIYLHNANFRLSRLQYLIWNCLLQLSIINWMLVQLSSYFGDTQESFLYQKLALIRIVPKPFVEALIAIIALLAFVATVNLLMCKLLQQRLPPLPAVLLLFFAVLLFLPCNPIASLQPSIWLFAPALFHGSQYLCVVAAKIGKASSLASSSSSSSSGFPLQSDTARFTLLLKRYCQCLLLAIAIFLLLPWLLAVLCQPLGVTYAVAVAAVFVGVQVYHMAIDSVIWRDCASLL